MLYPGPLDDHNKKGTGNENGTVNAADQTRSARTLPEAPAQRSGFGFMESQAGPKPPESHKSGPAGLGLYSMGPGPAWLTASGRAGTALEGRVGGAGCRPSEVVASAVLAFTGASSIEAITSMTILLSLSLRLLKGRSCACFSSACVPVYCVLCTVCESSALSLSRVCQPAVTLTVHHLSSLFRNTAAALHAYSESAHFCANVQKNLLGNEKRRRLGVCVSVSGSGWNMSMRPHRSLR